MTDNTEQKNRKERPVARGVLDYFPDAIAAVANVSYVGNQQHNPGESMHWDRSKSGDHADCVARHLMERGKLDSDGLRHSAKVAWRALALLQIELENGADDNGLRQAQADRAKDILLTEDDGSVIDRVRFGSRTFHGGPDQMRELSLLLQYGCPTGTARQIVNGTSFAGPKPIDLTLPFVYIAGPMRDKPGNNFPAFDKARDLLLKAGYNVISPADIDRVSDTKQSEDQTKFFLRDMFSLYFLKKEGNPRNAVCLLPAWWNSRGAAGEFFSGRWLDLPFLGEVGESGNIESINLPDLIDCFKRHNRSL